MFLLFARFMYLCFQICYFLGLAFLYIIFSYYIFFVRCLSFSLPSISATNACTLQVTLPLTEMHAVTSTSGINPITPFWTSKGPGANASPVTCLPTPSHHHTSAPRIIREKFITYFANVIIKLGCVETYGRRIVEYLGLDEEGWGGLKGREEG